MATSLTYYIKVTSDALGALSIFHLYGDDEELGRVLDTKICLKTGRDKPNLLENRELRYGWLRTDDGVAVDEVMVGKPQSGFRVLTTHGGAAVAQAVEAFLAEQGCDKDVPENLLANDALYNNVLSSCLTEAQAAAVLHAAAAGTPIPGCLMATHRVLLAGAPNAGKSSLLNALAGYDRAFVDPEAGATRDVVDELVDIGGYAVWLGDLPGFGLENSPISREARARALDRLRLAEMIWLVVDGSAEWNPDAAVAVASARGEAAVAVILNKSDLPAAFSGTPWREFFPDAPVVRVSSLPDGDAAVLLGGLAHRLWGKNCTVGGRVL